MKCPRCVHYIHRAAELCPHCGFSIEHADAGFGSKGLRLQCLTDGAGILRSGDREQVAQAVEKFNNRFPQLFIAVYTGSLGEVAKLQPFGFWLLNRSIFEDISAGKSNDGGVLLTIDPEIKAANIVFGYLLEPYLSENDTFDSLARAHGHWLDGRYADGLVRVITHLELLLIKRSRQGRRLAKKYERQWMRSGSALNSDLEEVKQ